MAEAHPAATKRRADSQTVGGLREDTEISSIASDSDSSDDWTNKSFDDVETAAKAKDDRWSGEDEPEQDEIPQPQTRQSLDSRSGAKRGFKEEARLGEKQTAKESRHKSKKSRATGSGTSDLPGKAEGRYRSRPDEKKSCPEEGPRAGASHSKERESRGRKKKPAVLKEVGLTLKLYSALDKRHTLIVEGDRVSAREHGPEEEDEVLDNGDGQFVECSEQPQESHARGTADEDWFERNLKQLPTIFKWARVHCITAPRLQNIQSNLNDSWLELANSDDDDDKGDPDDADVSVKLLETDEGFTRVLKDFVTTDGRKESARSNPLSNLKVVIQWLLGHAREAEKVAQEARRVLRVYPFSFVARANVFYILWRKGDRAEAVDTLMPLVELWQRRPETYRMILSEEQGEVGRCLTEFGPEFAADAVFALEQEVKDNPKRHHAKFFWAVNLRLLTASWYKWTRAVSIKDMSDKILKAVDLLLQVLQAAEEEDLPVMKEAAAAELGEIITIARWNFWKKLKNIERRCQNAGLDDAAACFDMVIQMEGTGRVNLWRVGKFFRYSGELKKSETVLNRAVTIAPNSSKAHHHLALTLKKMAKMEKDKALQQARNQRGPNRQHRPRSRESREDTITNFRKEAGDTEMKKLQISMKAEMCSSLSRAGKHVEKAMCHFKKALRLSGGENSDISHDLGLMHKAFGEYTEALEHFLAIMNIDTEPVNVVNAFEQSGLVYLEQYSQTGTGKLQEKGRIMLNMAILVQTRIVRGYRRMQGQKNCKIWQSLYSLGQYLHEKDVEGECQLESTAELWLLRLLRVYADTVPVLTVLQQYTQRDATDPEELKNKLNRYLRNDHRMDAVVLSSILQLTHEGRMLESDLLDLVTRAHVQAARTRLLDDLDEGNTGSTFNTNIAKRLFRWAFEDTHPALEEARAIPAVACHQPVKGLPAAQRRHHKNVHRRGYARTEEDRLVKKDKAARVAQEVDHASTNENSWSLPELSGTTIHNQPDSYLEYHVVLVHEPHDPCVERAAEDLQAVLQNTCGLKAHLTKPNLNDVTRRATLETMSHARLLLFILGKKGMSPEMESYIGEATRRSPIADMARKPTSGVRTCQRKCQNLLILTLDSDAEALTPLLQNYPTLPWRSCVGRRMTSSADEVCTLFNFLLRAEADISTTDN